jgi:hypothetical protein
MAFEPTARKMTAPRRAPRARGAARRGASRGHLAAAALVVWLVLALPAGAQASNACTNLANCTAIQASSWLAVPAGATGAPSTAGVLETCPESNNPDELDLAIGADYVLSVQASPFKLIVGRAMFGPGAGLTTGENAPFFVTNYETFADAVKPTVGCVTEALSAIRGAPRPTVVLEVQQRKLKPTPQGTRLGATRQLTYIRRCKAGQRLIDAIGGVLFDTRRAPSKRELNQVSFSSRITGGEARFVARLGPQVSDNRHVTIQTTDVCRT